MIIDKETLAELFAQAEASPRKRMNLDMRTSAEDGSQRMLNALLPGTEVAIHRHPMSSETVICLSGRMDEVIYKEASPKSSPKGKDLGIHTAFEEAERIHLCPAEGKYGCQIPQGVWHTVEVFEPSVIFESKDKAYGQDGSEIKAGT